MHKIVTRFGLMSMLATGLLTCASKQSLYQTSSSTPLSTGASSTVSSRSSSPGHDDYYHVGAGSPRALHSASTSSSQPAVSINESKGALRVPLYQPVVDFAYNNQLVACVGGGAAAGAVISAVSDKIPFLGWCGAGAVAGAAAYKNRAKLELAYRRIQLGRSLMQAIEEKGAPLNASGDFSLPSIVERLAIYRSMSPAQIADFIKVTANISQGSFSFKQ